MSKEKNIKMIATILFVICVACYLVTTNTDLGLQKREYAIVVGVLVFISLSSTILSLLSMYRSTNSKDKFLFLLIGMIALLIAAHELLGAALINM